MKQPNFQDEARYNFNIQKLINVPIFVQSVSLPGVYTQAPQTGTTFVPAKHVGDSLTFTDLIVTIRLDEGMESWYEMFKWLTGLTRTETFQQFIDLVNDSGESLDGKKLFKARESLGGGKGYKNIKSTASLSILDSNFQPYLELVFMALHPTGIGGMQFRTDGSNHNYVTFDVTFAYDFYFPKPAKNS